MTDPQPTLGDELTRLGPGAWELFTDDYVVLCAGAEWQADEIVRRALVVAEALGYTGDPLAPVWAAAVTHVAELVQFHGMIRGLDPDDGPE